MKGMRQMTSSILPSLMTTTLCKLIKPSHAYSKPSLTMSFCQMLSLIEMNSLREWPGLETGFSPLRLSEKGSKALPSKTSKRRIELIYLYIIINRQLTELLSNKQVFHEFFFIHLSNKRLHS